MICPECRQNLTTYNITTVAGKKVSIEKCPACFGFWLDQWEANVLSQKDVEKISQDDKKKGLSVISSFAKKCPHCQVPLVLTAQEGESNVVTFNCPQCRGSWFPAGQLLEFKKEKGDLNKTISNLPLKSIPNYLFPAIIICLIAISLPVGLKLLQTPKETRTQAEEKIQKIHVIPLSSTAVIISFKSASTSTSEVHYGIGQNNLHLQASQTTPSFYQQIKLQNLQPNTTYYYQVVLKEAVGKSTVSEILNFTTEKTTQEKNFLD